MSETTAAEPETDYYSSSSVSPSPSPSSSSPTTANSSNGGGCIGDAAAAVAANAADVADAAAAADATGDDKRLDLARVLDRFERSCADSATGTVGDTNGDDNDGDVNTDLYLDGYAELNKFFALMGSVFGFVSGDLIDKIGILRAFRERPDVAEAAHFRTFGAMLRHEQQTGLLQKSDYVSASRTLLRLHRGLGE